MPTGANYGTERCRLRDEVTGLSITRLTSFPCVNMKLYMQLNQFTPDSGTLVFLSASTYNRGMEFAAFRVGLDGSDLTQITDYAVMEGAVLAPDGKYFYFLCSGVLYRAPLTGSGAEPIGRVPGAGGVCLGGGICDSARLMNGSISADGRIYVCDLALVGGMRGIARFDTSGGDAEIIYNGPSVSHVQFEPGESRLIAFSDTADDQGRGIFTIDCGGNNKSATNLVGSNGHWLWLGNTRSVFSTMVADASRLVACDIDTGETRTIIQAEALHFWHAGARADGALIAADTNWPDMGIKLINAKTGHMADLCYPRASSCHPQYTHCHPSFSPDGRYVVYNSDRSGTPQIYAAELPPELIASII